MRTRTTAIPTAPAEVIAEVWTLLDGECTPESCGDTRGLPGVPGGITGSRNGLALNGDQVPRRQPLRLAGAFG